jgi:hypothetical protein
VSATDEALAALAASRARLHGALVPATDEDTAGAAVPWRHALRLARVIAWQAVPPAWRAWGRLLLAPLGDAAQPLVRRHPAPALLLSACAGAALVLLRPWRWHFPSLQAMAGPVLPVLLAWMASHQPARDEPAAAAAPAPPANEP